MKIQNFWRKNENKMLTLTINEEEAYWLQEALIAYLYDIPRKMKITEINKLFDIVLELNKVTRLWGP